MECRRCGEMFVPDANAKVCHFHPGKLVRRCCWGLLRSLFDFTWQSGGSHWSLLGRKRPLGASDTFTLSNLLSDTHTHTLPLFLHRGYVIAPWTAHWSVPLCCRCFPVVFFLLLVVLSMVVFFFGLYCPCGGPGKMCSHVLHAFLHTVPEPEAYLAMLWEEWRGCSWLPVDVSRGCRRAGIRTHQLHHIHIPVLSHSDGLQSYLALTTHFTPVAANAVAKNIVGLSFSVSHSPLSLSPPALTHAHPPK